MKQRPCYICATPPVDLLQNWPYTNWRTVFQLSR